MAAPEKVGQIQIQDLLDESPEGCSYKGLQAGLGRTVAIRLIKPALAADADYRTRFLSEAKRGFKVSVENAARLIDVGHCKTSNLWFISYELVSGHTISETIGLHGGTMRSIDVLELGSSLCEALASAAAQGLHHGDIRPERIRVDSNGAPKLLDLGLAKARKFVVTDRFAAPERIAGGEADARSDLFSLGVCLYLMLTGKTPAPTRAPAYDVRRVDPAISKAVGKIIWILTSKAPASGSRTRA